MRGKFDVNTLAARTTVILPSWQRGLVGVWWSRCPSAVRLRFSMQADIVWEIQLFVFLSFSLFFIKRNRLYAVQRGNRPRSGTISFLSSATCGVVKVWSARQAGISLCQPGKSFDPGGTSRNQSEPRPWTEFRIQFRSTLIWTMISVVSELYVSDSSANILCRVGSIFAGERVCVCVFHCCWALFFYKVSRPKR